MCASGATKKPARRKRTGFAKLRSTLWNELSAPPGDVDRPQVPEPRATCQSEDSAASLDDIERNMSPRKRCANATAITATQQRACNRARSYS